MKDLWLVFPLNLYLFFGGAFFWWVVNNTPSGGIIRMTIAIPFVLWMIGYRCGLVRLFDGRWPWSKP